MLPFMAIILAFLVQHSSAYNELTGTTENWKQFPPLQHIDRFTQCLNDNRGVYCTGYIEFVAGNTKQLYDEMRKHSKSPLHLNHTKGIYGYCMSQRCAAFMSESSAVDLETALGACLNSTLQREYGLRARIERSACYRHGDTQPLTWLDRAAIALLLIVISLIAAGTVYDLFVPNKDPKGYLMCFSLPANWAKLWAPWPKDKTTARLIGINGIRSITAIQVVLMHAMVIIAYSENKYDLEKMFESSFSQIYLQSTAIMQTFFFISGMLLTFNVEKSNERKTKTWRSLPRAILLRWLRLAPVPLVVLLLSMTWLKFVPVAPLRQISVSDEVQDCQKSWLAIFFFINNYVQNGICVLQLWSTYVDFHMHIIGLTILYLSPTRRFRNSLLWTFLLIGMAVPVIETYARDLNGAFVMLPKLIYLRDLADYKTFKYTYLPSHNNIPSFAIGMILGALLCDWQKNPIDLNKYKKFTILYWLVLPVMALLSMSPIFVLWSGGDINIRLLLALLRNPVWALTIALLTAGMIYQLDNMGVYRRVLEWPGWVPPARVAYCTYTMHPMLIRALVGTSLGLFTASTIHQATLCIGFMIISFMAATVLWLAVEAPCTNIIAKLFPEKRNSLRLYSPDKKD